MVLQGFDKDTLENCKDTLRIKASGNAYPVPLLMAVLHGVLMVLKDKIPKSAAVKGPIKDPCNHLAKFDKYMEQCAEETQGDGGKTKKPITQKKKVLKKKTAAKKSKTGKKQKAMKKVKKTQTKKTKTQTKRTKRHQSKNYYKYMFMSSPSS